MLLRARNPRQLPTTYVARLSPVADHIHMNLRPSLPFASLIAVAIVAGLSTQACSDRKPTSASIPAVDAGEALHISTPAGGMTADLTAYFDGDHLHRIVETRTAAGGAVQHADYRFTQARLTQYTGDDLQGARIELTFDLHGVLTNSSPEVGDDTIASIRNRAELLRSLALARRTTQQHSTY